MNTPDQWRQDGEEIEYHVQGVRRQQPRVMHSRRFNHSRAGSRTASAGGIHRRRNKRWSW